MRRKMRCDSKLHGLPVEQRVKVGIWLFEESFTYKEVVKACLSEFGLKVSKSSVGRYYERVSADRFAKLQRVERRKAENWMARECLRHWRRTMGKQPHVSYLPMLPERKALLHPNVLKGGVGVVENEGSAGALNPTREGACAPRKAGGTDMSTNGGQRSARPTSGCEQGRGAAARVDTAWHHP